MAIDILNEDVITLDEAARMVPGKNGGTIHPFTVGLWASRGRKGVILESLLCGARRVTSKQALQRFFDNVTAVSANRKTAQAITVRERTHREQAAAARRACRELEAAGA